MTIFAVIIASLFPIIHLGRPWIFYWIIPYPNQRTLWPDFQSPLIFDFLAVSTYLTVSVLFWYTGLVPDLAAARDRTEGIRRKIYGFFSLGWSGTDRQWHHYGSAYLLLAGAVHAAGHLRPQRRLLGFRPGHHTGLPQHDLRPLFCGRRDSFRPGHGADPPDSAAADFSLEKIITIETLEKIAKTSILMALIVGYAYVVEPFIAWYSGNVFERQTFLFRAIGYYAPLFWIMCFCNVVAPLFFFFKKVRTKPCWLFTIAILINIGMWLERFVIIFGSMARDYIPYAWGNYWPNWVDWSITFGSFCLFFLFFLLFAKFLPALSMTEIKEEAGAPVRPKEVARGAR